MILSIAKMSKSKSSQKKDNSMTETKAITQSLLNGNIKECKALDPEGLRNPTDFVRIIASTWALPFMATVLRGQPSQPDSITNDTEEQENNNSTTEQPTDSNKKEQKKAEKRMARQKKVHRPIPVVLSLVRLLDIQSNDTDRFLQPNAMFQLKLSYASGRMEWTIWRSLMDLFRLHSTLLLASNQHGRRRLPTLPTFPNQAVYLLDIPLLLLKTKEARRQRRMKHLQQRKETMMAYLNELFLRLGSSMCSELCEFLEISSLSFAPRHLWLA